MTRLLADHGDVGLTYLAHGLNVCVSEIRGVASWNRTPTSYVVESYCIVEKYLQQHHHVLFEFYWLVDLEQQYRVLSMLLRLYHRNSSSGDIVPIINTNQNPVTSRKHRHLASCSLELQILYNTYLTYLINHMYYIVNMYQIHVC